jgi:glycerophosphoryl diester phosphodiesterase
VDLRARDGRVLRVGHRGAAALEPENTLRSFERAVELGVDVVEFDVLDLRDGTVVLAHSDDLFEVSHGAATGQVRSKGLEELRRAARDLPTLDEALAFFVERAPETGVQVDLKWHGFEAPVVEALSRHGLVRRAVVSSFHAHSLRAVRALDPSLATGLTYPYDRYYLSRRRPLAPVLLGAMLTLRRMLPARIGGLLRRAGATAAMLHHSVVSPAVVLAAHAIDAPVVAWTVDDPRELDRVVRSGVDAVTTNDPRIFGTRL